MRDRASGAKETFHISRLTLTGLFSFHLNVDMLIHSDVIQGKLEMLCSPLAHFLSLLLSFVPDFLSVTSSVTAFQET